MSSSKTFLTALCALLLALPLLAENRNDSRSKSRNDSQSSSTSDETAPPIPREVGGKTYEDWMKDLSHADPSIRANAISMIPFFREKAMGAIPLIVERMHDKDASPRVKAVLAIKIMGIRETDRTRVVKALGERISTDTQAIVRYEAAIALRRFGPDGQEVTADLVKGIGDASTWELRSACIHALIVAGVDPKKGPDTRVIDALLLRTNTFYETTFKVRLEAIIALGALGRPQNPEKLRQVLATLKSPANYNSQNKTIRIWSHVSLMALEEKVNAKYLQTVADYLKDREADVRAQAVMALGALEDKAHEHVGDICRMLQYEKEPAVRGTTCEALGRMGDRSPRVLRALIRQTEWDDTENVSVVLSACGALAQLRVPDADVMEALNKVLDHKSLDLRAKNIVRDAIKDIQKPRDLTKKRKPQDTPKGEITEKKRAPR
jgi:HEAT repeat protein